MTDDNNDKICRYCLEADNISDLIVPCRCRGSMCYIHRSCLDEWRIRHPNDENFYRCRECKFSFVFEERGDSPEAQKWRTFIYYCYVVRDLLLAFALFQSIVVFLGFISYACDSSNQRLMHFLSQTIRLHEETTTFSFWYYYLFGYFVFFVFVGLIGLLCFLIEQCGSGCGGNCWYRSPFNHYSYSDYCRYESHQNLNGTCVCCCECRNDSSSIASFSHHHHHHNHNHIGSSRSSCSSSDSDGVAYCCLFVCIIIAILGVVIGFCYAASYINYIRRTHASRLWRKGEVNVCVVMNLENKEIV